MIILPAIDIIDQKPVRLYQGDYQKQEQVADSILETALRFEKEGAEYVHMVDLDGAKEGKKCNQKILCEVSEALSIPVEVGGGIRCMDDVEFYIRHGISRVILGTAAIEDPSFLQEALRTYGHQIAVGIDCKNGYVCGRGWLSESKLQYIDFAKQMCAYGVSTIIVTDISRDGTMQGPNIAMLREITNLPIQIIASGGIRDITHIQALKVLGIYGAISGKAMYANTLSLKEALALCKEE